MVNASQYIDVARMVVREDVKERLRLVTGKIQAAKIVLALIDDVGRLQEVEEAVKEEPRERPPLRSREHRARVFVPKRWSRARRPADVVLDYILSRNGEWVPSPDIRRDLSMAGMNLGTINSALAQLRSMALVRRQKHGRFYEYRVAG